MIVDLFAGPGGWSEGIRQHLGLTDIGLEWDASACKTRAAAGHTAIQCDVAQYPTRPFADRIRGLIGSPPCQTYSQGGKQAGLADWRQYAEHLRTWGYSVWCGELNAADYGVGQARRRAILIASQVRKVTAPDPTHSEYAEDDLFGTCRPRWISMAEALGWGYTQRPAPTVTGGGADTGGAEPWSSTSRKAMRDAMDNPGHWAWRKPAPTVSGTVGHVGGKQAGGHLNLSPEEGAVLQTFPRDYPFQGNKGQRSLQIGNAVPPWLAAHVVSAATGIPLPAAHRLAPAA